MRILWVKAGKLLPPDTGGKLRSYHLLKELARSHAVVVYTYYEGAHDQEYEAEVAATFPGAITRRTPGGSFPGLALRYARHLFHPIPFSVFRYTWSNIERELRSLLATGEFDVAVCDFLAPSLNFPSASPTPLVLFQHNVESLLWRRRAANEARPLWRRLYALEAARMHAYEARALRRFERVVAVSPVDRAEFEAMAPGIAVDVVPTGVDVRTFERATRSKEAQGRNTVLFVGSMDWQPNVDGVLWFCREIWPLVLQQHPRSYFRIVGRRPGKRVRALTSENVEIVGDVESVVPYLHEAAVVVVPLRAGGGTRLKILEAFAAGCAVVSTKVGAEGLPVVDGGDILLRDAPAEFARAVVELLEDSDQRQRLAAAARAKAKQFDWAAVVAHLEAALKAATTCQASGSEVAIER
jgi:glycosyltransferase involved in cell wall biosynthesis